MRHFRSYLLVLLMMKLSIPLISCQPVDNHFTSAKVDSIRTIYLDYNISHALAPEKLSIVFPEQLSGLKRTGIKLDKIVGSATASYGNNKYEISIIDDLRNNFSNIFLFNRKYRRSNESKKEERTIKTVRDGYKTITTIINSETTSIAFVFKKRYLFKITGTSKQTPYMVWRFLELNKFHDLEE